MALGIDPTNDFVFRMTFANPDNADLLLHLINAILAPAAPIVNVEILNPDLDPEYDGDKFSILDVKARDSEGRLFNIEMQTSLTAALRERLVYYAACLFTSELGEGDPYALLRPTIGICLLSAVMFPDVAEGHQRFTLCDARSQIELTQHFQIHIVELPKYIRDVTAMPAGDQLDRWAWWFQRAADFDANELRRLLPEAQFQKATGILEMISRTPTQRDLYEARQKALRDEVWKLAEARSEGLLEGREEGLWRGLRIGRIEQLQMLQRILGESESPNSELQSLSLEQLTARVQQLQDRSTRR